MKDVERAEKLRGLATSLENLIAFVDAEGDLLLGAKLDEVRHWFIRRYLTGD